MTRPGDTHAATLSTLLRRSTGAFTLQSVGAAANLVAQSAIARALGVVAFGRYSIAFTVAQVVATPADLGAQTSVTRFVPEYRVQGETRKLRGVVIAAQLVPLVVGSLAAAIACAVVYGFGLGGGATALFAVAFAGVPLFALSVVQMTTLRALGRIVGAIAPVLILQPLLLLGVVLALPDGSLTTYGVATVAVLLAVVVLQVIMLHPTLAGTPKPATFQVRHWLSVSLPLLVVNVVQLAFQRLDIVAVGVLLDARSAGIYAVANRFAVAAASLQKAMITVVAPEMSGLHWSGRTAEVEALVLRGLRLTFPPALLVTVALGVVGGPLLGLVGHPFREGYLALVVYATGQLIGVASGPVGWLATIIGRHREMARIAVLSATLAVVGYAVLIPTLGIVGAALANAVGIAFRNACSARLVRRHGFHISLARALRRDPRPA